MAKNIVIAHGGAPTAVINASLAGAVRFSPAKWFWRKNPRGQARKQRTRGR